MYKIIYEFFKRFYDRAKLHSSEGRLLKLCQSPILDCSCLGRPDDRENGSLRCDALHFQFYVLLDIKYKVGKVWNYFHYKGDKK